MTVVPLYVAVSVVLPTATPVTNPFFETVAIAVFAVCQLASDVTFSTSALLETTTLAEY